MFSIKEFYQLKGQNCTCSVEPMHYAYIYVWFFPLASQQNWDHITCFVCISSFMYNCHIAGYFWVEKYYFHSFCELESQSELLIS